MIPRDGVDEFGQVLARVRDRAVLDADFLLDPRFKKDSPGLRIRKAIADGMSGEELVKLVIPEIIDLTIARLLEEVRPDCLDITFRAPSGEVVELARDWAGQLAGLYLAEWREEFFKSRFTSWDEFGEVIDWSRLA